MAVTAFVSASALRAKCLNILNRLAPHEPERVVVTRLKRAVAMLAPPGRHAPGRHISDRHAEAVRDIHGFMRGTIIVADDADLTAPLLDPPSAAESDPRG